MNNAASLTVRLIAVNEINDGVRRHCSVSEAARLLGVSEGRVRYAAKRAGVNKIAGRTVRGGLLIDRHPVPLVIAYTA